MQLLTMTLEMTLEMTLKMTLKMTLTMTLTLPLALACQHAPSTPSGASPATVADESPRLETVPAWALSNSQRDANTEVGVGSGPTLERATRAALEDLASRLSVDIESRTRDVSHELDGTTTESLEQVIETRVLGTRVNGWERTRSTHSAGVFWVEVRVDREKLARESLMELGEAADHVDRMLDDAQGSALRRLLALQATSGERDRARHLIALLDGLESDFPRESWKARQRRWELAEASSRRALIFAVRPDPQSVEIARWLELALAAKRLAIRDGGCFDRDTICIYIRSEIVEAEVARRHIAQIRSIFSVHEPGGGLLQEQDLTGRGDSSSDPDRARRAALDDLHDRMGARPILDDLLP